MSPLNSSPAIETRGLVKSFGGKAAVDGIDLTVERGAIYGVLGPNGAGKTTTVRLLATLIRPDAGTATVLGHDVVREADAVRRRISLTGQFASVDEDLTGYENLVLLARLLGFPRKRAKRRADELLHAFDLTEAAGRQVTSFSGGMRRRLDIAASIIATPDLLFLDEPTTGLDPRSRNEVWEIVRALVAGGATVLLTTQYLEEADHLADRIAVIDRGRVIAEGTSPELKASVGTGVLHIRLSNAEDRMRAMAILTRVVGGPVHAETDGKSIAVQLSDSARAAAGLSALADTGIGIAGFSLSQPSLDEVFFALTGHGALPTDDATAANRDPHHG
jgi:ABC-2 type transport system ATP-binding protein